MTDALILPARPSKTEGVVWLLAAMSRPGGVRWGRARSVLGTSTRNLRRYVATLRGLGLDIKVEDPVGVRGGDDRRLRLRGARFVVGDR